VNHEHKKNHNKQDSFLCYRAYCYHSSISSIRRRTMDERDDAWRQFSECGQLELDTDTDQSRHWFSAWFGSRQEEMVIDRR